MDATAHGAQDGRLGDTTIAVRGSHSEWFAAERATVKLSAGFQGPSRKDSLDQASASAVAVRESIEALADEQAGPITWWSSDRVSVWTERPWNSEGKQLPPVFHADVAFSAKFLDFDVLATWLEDVASLPGVTISDVLWTLTRARTESVVAEVRSAAVKDAVDKATTFAQSIGLSTVRAVALADPGLLGEQPVGMRAASYDMMSAKATSGGLVFKPEEIEVSATVDVRFVAT